MKKIIIKGIVLILILFTLTGCSKQQRKAHDFYLPLDTSEFTLGEHPIPVTIGEVEVFVGETTLQTLLDADFPVVASEWNGSEVIEHEVDSTYKLYRPLLLGHRLHLCPPFCRSRKRRYQDGRCHYLPSRASPFPPCRHFARYYPAQ